jgi:hypothetical protein
MSNSNYLDLGTKRRIVLKLPGVDTIVFSLLALYSFATFAFLVFGLIADEIDLGNLSTESLVRISLALINIAVAASLYRNPISLSLWALVVLLVNFIGMPLVATLQQKSFGQPTWESLINQQAVIGTISGFQTIGLLLNGSTLLAVAIAVLFRRLMTKDSSLGKLDASLVESWDNYRKTFMGAQIFNRITGVLIVAWAVFSSYILIFGVVTNQIGFNTESWDARLQIAVVASVLYLTLSSQWAKRNLAWITVFTVLWEFGLGELVFSFSIPRSNLSLVQNFGNNSLLTVLGRVALVLAVVSLVALSIKGLIDRYSQRVTAWIDRRIAELYEGETESKANLEPRTTSVMAVLSLIFSFLFPLIGLILAYSARNEIAVSRGRKYGTDLTIAAAIISWLGIYLTAFLILFIAAILPLLGSSDFFYFLGNLF